MAGAAPALGGALAAACGGAPEQPAASSKAAATITFSTWEIQDQVDLVTSILEPAARAQGLKLEALQQVQEYYPKITALAAGGTPPDAMLIHNYWVADWSSKGALVKLDDLAKRDGALKLSDFFPGVLGGYRAEAGLVALPWHNMPYALYFNKGLFDRVGVKHPDGTWTWDAFLDTAKRLTLDADRDGKTDQFGYLLETAFVRAHNFILAAGGDIVDNPSSPKLSTLDRPPAVEAMEFQADLRHKHKVAPSTEDLAEMNKKWSTTNFQAVAFELGAAAMMLTGFWNVANFSTKIKQFEWGVAPVPRGKGGRKISLNSNGVALLAGGKQADRAWDFAKLCVSAPVGEGLLLAGHTMPPVRKVAVEKAAAFKMLARPDYEGFVAGADVASTLP